MKNHEIALTLTPQKNSRDGYRLVESPVSSDPSQVQPTLLHTSPREISRYASTPPNTPSGPPVYTAGVSDTAPGEAAAQVSTHPNTYSERCVRAHHSNRAQRDETLRCHQRPPNRCFPCVLVSTLKLNAEPTNIVSRADVEHYVKNPVTRQKLKGALWRRVDSYQQGIELLNSAEARRETRIILLQ
jgi:hypothetical protein